MCKHASVVLWSSLLVLVQDSGVGNCWDQHIHSISNMLQLSYQNKQPMTPSAFFDQLARQVGRLPPLVSRSQPPPLAQALMPVLAALPD